MNQREFIREAVVAAVVGVLWVVLSSMSIKGSLERQRHYGLRRLEKTTAVMIERAHNLNDDLVTQEVVSGLSKAPGILFGCVVGKDGKILAHSQPSQMGQPFLRSSLPVRVTRLGEGPEPWGKLVMAVSDRNLQDAQFRQQVLCSLSGMVLWSVWMGCSWSWRRRWAERDHRATELLALMEELTLKQTRENEKQIQARQQWMAWLQSAVDHVSSGLVILDSKQRIVSVNLAAAALLGVTDHSMLSGKSWYELPLVEFSHKVVEQSLQAPEKCLESILPAKGVRLVFSSFKAGLGTSILFYASKNQ